MAEPEPDEDIRKKKLYLEHEELKQACIEGYSAYKYALEDRGQAVMAALEEDYYDNIIICGGVGWLHFDMATLAIQYRLGVSLGVADRTLRELCASGDVRATKFIDRQPDQWAEP